MRARVIRITGSDLNHFEFDFDLTWVCFFVNANGKIYGRYGGRDAKGPDTRNSLEGLHFAMEAALETHRQNPNARPDEVRPPLYVEKLPVARNVRGCIHCHQAKELMRAQAKEDGTWKRDNVYTYPLPENVGITLDVNTCNLVSKVKPASAAATAGIQPGDVLLTLNDRPVYSFADAQYALHKSPLQGSINVAWKRGQQTSSGTLTLADGWKWTNLTWRPSMLDMLPSLTMYGDDLSSKEKMALGLDEKRLAFRQEDPAPPSVQAMGIRTGDIIIGVENRLLELTVDQFLGYVRQNYLVGEDITFNVVRGGKKMDVRATLK